MTKTRKVALLFPVGDPHLALSMGGINDYAAGHGGWQFAFAPESSTASVRSMLGWSGDGVIGMLVSRNDIDAARKIGRPFVNFAGALKDSVFPRVMVDHEAVGRLAAEHLMARGFRRVGFYGLRGVWYSQLRHRGFLKAVRPHGAQCSVLETHSSLNQQFRWDVSVDSLRQWLKTLPLPAGILAVNDHRATMVVEACLEMGLSVPHDVAVIGVGNKEASCEACRVPISSVLRNGWKVGYEAAALLDRMMSGTAARRGDILIQPEGIVERASTDVVAIDDPHVSAAVRFIEEHAGEAFGVEALEAVVPICRRSLEQRFRRCLNRTPYEHICRTRVAHAKRLLDLPEARPLCEIAVHSGFPDSRLLQRVFRRVTGMTAAEYRRSQIRH
jgi:LacI family transcriptional regulator